MMVMVTMMAGCCVWMIYRALHPSSAADSTHSSKMKQASSWSWKHFFTDVIIPPVSSSDMLAVLGMSRTKPFSSLWMLSFVCCTRVVLYSIWQCSWIFQDGRLLRVPEKILPGCTESLSMPSVSVCAGWMMSLFINFLKRLLRPHAAFPLSHSHLAVWRYEQK